MTEPATYESILLTRPRDWNWWRKDNPDVKPNLSGLSLSQRNLDQFDFSGCTCIRTDFSGAELRHADFSSANVSSATFKGAMLAEAVFNETGISKTDFSSSNLRGALFTRITSYGTNFDRADLTGSEISSCRFEYPVFSGAVLKGCRFLGTILEDGLFDTDFSGVEIAGVRFIAVDLTHATGLRNVIPTARCVISADSLFRSRTDLPDEFLKAVTIPNDLIEFLHSLRSGKPIQFYTCFISYASADRAFADRLYADLQAHNARCWLATHDLKIGDKFRIAIDEAIRLHDKLLLVLSSASMDSSWVESEVETAFEQERITKRNILFPIRLDDAVLQSSRGWPAEIRRSRHIGDFRKWKDHDSYAGNLARLLRDLELPLRASAT